MSEIIKSLDNQAGVKRVKITDLTPDPRNANLGTERGLAMLDDSLRSLGAGRSILVDKNGVIIAGNKTHSVAVDIGLEDVLLVPTDGKQLVAVVRTDLDIANDPKAVRLALADNRISEADLAWSPEVLLELADTYGRELTAGLWSESEWSDSVVSKVAAEAVAEDAPTESDLVDALQEKWGTAPGQLWVVPSVTSPGLVHRLYCGDSTKPADVSNVMPGGILANLLVTSPPYWVGMSYESQQAESEIDAFIRSCAKSWTNFVNVNCGRIVINTGTAAIHRIDKSRKTEVLILVDKWQSALKQQGWLARNIRIWAKSGDLPATIGPRTDVVDQHWESFVEFDHNDSDFEYLATFWSPAGDQRGQERADSAWAQQGVWYDIPGEASAGGKHVAAFPIEIPRRFIILYTKPGEVVLDPFLGSGTTIIACEIAHRAGAGVELSPKYLAAALERLTEFGLTPELVNG